MLRISLSYTHCVVWDRHTNHRKLGSLINMEREKAKQHMYSKKTIHGVHLRNNTTLNSYSCFKIPEDIETWMKNVERRKIWMNNTFWQRLRLTRISYLIFRSKQKAWMQDKYDLKLSFNIPSLACNWPRKYW